MHNTLYISPVCFNALYSLIQRLCTYEAALSPLWTWHSR